MLHLRDLVHFPRGFLQDVFYAEVLYCFIFSEIGFLFVQIYEFNDYMFGRLHCQPGQVSSKL